MFGFHADPAKSSCVQLFVGFLDAAKMFFCWLARLYCVTLQFCSRVGVVTAMVDIARALVNGELGTVGGSEGSEPRIQLGPEEDPVLQRYDGTMLMAKTFVETCGKERGAISIGRGADLLVGLAHFPLLLPKQVPVLLQRLLLFHHHHPDPFTSLHKPAGVPFHGFCLQHKDSCPVEKA